MRIITETQSHFSPSVVSANDPCLESANCLGTGRDSKFISAEHEESLRISGNGEIEVKFGTAEGGDVRDNRFIPDMSCKE